MLHHDEVIPFLSRLSASVHLVERSSITVEIRGETNQGFYEFKHLYVLHDLYHCEIDSGGPYNWERLNSLQVPGVRTINWIDHIQYTNHQLHRLRNS